MGQHVADYMKTLLDDDETAFKRQFSKFIKEGIVAENVSYYLTVVEIRSVLCNR
jgi:hypothetical protein